ncbi:MAG: NPCBM/NEW2 domain-containing protein [Planctomycetes bacterium]|nr:NPCBM/NEW2 domain-containing protein [Planctomycetota bacterium]
MSVSLRAALAASILLASAPDGMAEPDDIPREFRREMDREPVLASEAETRDAFRWARASFLGEETDGAAGASAPLRIEVLRQDHSTLRFGQSAIETPLRIGSKSFERGLGSHAASEIAVRLPEGARRFRAQVGVDNNHDTAGKRGSVRFAVSAGGKELLRTPVLRGGAEPLAVDVEISRGAAELRLVVDPADDGVGHDQADWAEARIVLEGGREVYLDEGQWDPYLIPDGPPFSFVYGGRPSEDLLRGWRREVSGGEAGAAAGSHGRIFWTASWTDPETGLRVRAEVAVFPDYAAVEWVLRFRNTSAARSPILEGVQAVDVRIRTASSKRAAVLHQITGDVCGARSFLPLRTELRVGEGSRFAPEGGRPSNGAFPFFDLEYGGEGISAAIGWSGQWAASLERSPGGPTRLRAGMERTRLYLEPGEEIRSPRILLAAWRGDRILARNRLRRLLLFHHAPQQGGKPSAMPFASQCFDRYIWTRPAWATEAGQIEAARKAAAMGFDAHWLDAAWFPGGFPNGVGNWSAKPDEFPRGLKPVSEECHRLGLRFVLWFEPERVAPGTQIAREHPEFVHGGEKGGLFKLDDPAARRWMADLLASRIKESGVDIYRNDFNIDPLPFWRAADPPDREGITEIRYVEGHYALWDELRERRPGLLIDNCSSGGRRIDLETIRRSVPFWRSDTSCSPGHADWNQVQSCGLGLYIPLHLACGWTPDPYDFRSSATTGAIAQWDYLDPAFSLEDARAAAAEARENSKFWYGDFYPLTSCSLAEDVWMAYQLHRPDLDAGLVLAFRRAESNYIALRAPLRGIDPGREYRIETLDAKRRSSIRRAAGRDLAAGLEMRIPEPGGSVAVRYEPAAP